MTARAPTVGVVVPMFNASATIRETVDSVLAQTYPSLDVVVVDDGSTDASAQWIVERARSDPRLRLIRQDNSGVAAARNAGAAALNCDYFAFIDADDLWAPEKIALQMTALAEAGERAGLAYTWFAEIDGQSNVVSLDKQAVSQGQVLRDLCNGNFIGNGSSMLVRRAVFEAAGGFDNTLRDRDAEGCEDLQFGLAAAQVTEFCLVPRYLTGYRITESNMSSDVRRMWRSARLVLAPYQIRHPEWAAEFREHLDGLAEWLMARSLAAGRLGPAARFFPVVFRFAPRTMIRKIMHYAKLYSHAIAARGSRTSATQAAADTPPQSRNYRREAW